MKRYIPEYRLSELQEVLLEAIRVYTVKGEGTPSGTRLSPFFAQVKQAFGFK